MTAWPDTPFDESMLDCGVIIRCTDEDLATELFDILMTHGIQWNGGGSMTRTYWRSSMENTCYRVNKRHALCRGNTRCYSDSAYDGYIKCTFYGMGNGVEIEESAFESIIGAGGTLR